MRNYDKLIETIQIGQEPVHGRLLATRSPLVV